MSELNLKDWLQYKLETSEDDPTSNRDVDSWLEDRDELINNRVYINMFIDFKKWQDSRQTHINRKHNDSNESSLLNEFRRDTDKTDKLDIVNQQEQWLKDNNIEYDEIVDHDTIKVGDVYLIIGGEKLTIKAITVDDDGYYKFYYTSIDFTDWCWEDFIIQHCIKQ